MIREFEKIAYDDGVTVTMLRLRMPCRLATDDFFGAFLITVEQILFKILLKAGE